MKPLLLMVSLCICGIANAKTFYVSIAGNDANPGTITLPFKNIQKLNTVMNAGDIAYIRGGTYKSTYNSASPYHLLFQNLIGTAANNIVIQNYPNETVIMDFNSVGVPTTCYTYGVLIESCEYLTLKGITFKNLRQVADGCGVSRGMSLTNSDNCRMENLDIYNMGGTGFVLEDSDDNLILNCDSHHNGDGLSDNGNDAWDNADGFAIDGNSAIPIINTSERNTFRYCRTWLNSDDGFEFFGVNGVVYVEGCWSMANGIKPWGTTNTEVTPTTMTEFDSAVWFNNSEYWSGGPGSASGEGWKLGESFDRSVVNTTIHFLSNCIAFNNRGTGYASNSLDLHGEGPVTGIHQILNCVAYSNGNDGFGFGTGWCTGTTQKFKNNWSWNNNQATTGADWVYDGNNSSNISNNVWSSVYQGVNYGNLYPTVKVSSADFVSVSSVGMDGPRQSDGSLPSVNYLRIKAGSDLINKGVYVGINYNGTAPDLGAYEFGNIVVPVTLLDFSGSEKAGKSLLQWSTATEINSSHFELERSTDGRNFETISSVNANGNTNSRIDYQSYDYYPGEGVNYYRLKIIDKDGQFEYSKTVSIVYKNTQPGSVEIKSAFIKDKKLQVNLTSLKNQTATVGLYDAIGRELFISNILLQKGINSINKVVIQPSAVYYFKFKTMDKTTALVLFKE